MGESRRVPDESQSSRLADGQPAAAAAAGSPSASADSEDAHVTTLSSYLPDEHDAGPGGGARLPDLVEAGKVPAMRGLSWIGAGFSLFRQSPWVWIGITVIYAVAYGVVAAVPFVGVLAIYLLHPVLFGGVMLGCDALRRGERLDVSHLFKGFDQYTGQLLGLGGVYLGAIIVTVIVSALVFLGLANMNLSVDELIAAVESDSGPPPHIVEPLTYFVGPIVLLVGLSATLVIGCAAVVLPGSGGVAIGSGGPGAQAEPGGLPEELAAVPASTRLALLLLGLLATLPLMLGWLVLGPVLVGSVYAAYRDIFPDSEDVDGYLAAA